MPPCSELGKSTGSPWDVTVLNLSRICRTIFDSESRAVSLLSLEASIIGCIGLNSEAVLGQSSCRSWLVGTGIGGWIQMVSTAPETLDSVSLCILAAHTRHTYPIGNNW